MLPTLAGLTGAKFPKGQVEGRNLLPLLADLRSPWPDRFLFTHLGRWPTGVNPDDFQWKTFAVRSQRFRWVNAKDLFDMEADPGQTVNVADRHPEVVREMRRAAARPGVSANAHREIVIRS